MGGKVTLRIVAGPMDGRVFEFERHDTFLFGRRSDCHVALPDDNYVSRHHFILEANPPDACIRDLGSMNGTFVNDKLCGSREQGETPEEGSRHRHPQVTLRDGDRIRVGDTIFQVKIEQSAIVGSVKCQRCGKEAIEEAGSGREGDYICASCRASAVSNPLALLRQRVKDEISAERREIEAAIHDYDIERKLGRGGMGAVYLARRKSDGEHYAIKVMLAKVAVDEQARESFIREMNILQGLRHQNIVSFVEGGSTGGAFFFVMDYCNRGSLSDLLEKHGGKLPLKVAAPIMAHTLKGLEFAHGAGFVHRDINPNNIMLHELNGQWMPRLSDFGIAKNFEQAGFSGMTTTGGYSGTFPFIPREQVTSFKYVKPVSDVWSIAATFYVMLTGRPPRAVKDGQDPLNAVLDNDADPIGPLAPELPPGIAAVIDSALKSNPRRRYPDARAFRRELKHALKNSGQGSGAQQSPTSG